MATTNPTDTNEVGFLPLRPAPLLPLRKTSDTVVTNKKSKKLTTFVDNKAFTQNELAFINFYCQGMPATKAALKAGYAQGTAINAFEILYRPRIWAEIQKRLRIHFEKLELTTEEVLEGFSRVTRANILDYCDVQEDGSFKVNLNNINRDQGLVIQELSYDAAGRPRIRLEDKSIARMNLARLLGMVTEKHEIAGKDGGPLTIQALDSIVINTTINQINIAPQDRQQIPETIEAITTPVDANVSS